MNYDIMIPTRNRQDALAISLPLMLNQSRKPRKLIVSDSSDDHDSVCRLVESAVVGHDVELVMIQSDRGKTTQSNRGLKEVESEVVMVPDDDALWHPGTAEAMLRAYERDEMVGAVCAADAATPPPEAHLEVEGEYTKSSFDRLVRRTDPIRRKIEPWIVPNPFYVYGQRIIASRPEPAWLKEENAVLVPWMTGFRQSFRTDLIRACGFDSRMVNYAGFDDVDTSFQILKTHHLVGARNAQVFHYRFPGSRSDGFGMGMRSVLGRTYVICKHAEIGSPARRSLKRYNAFKLLGYRLRARSEYGRERVLGALRAIQEIRPLLEAPCSEVPQRYPQVRAACLDGRPEC